MTAQEAVQRRIDTQQAADDAVYALRAHTRLSDKVRCWDRSTQTYGMMSVCSDPWERAALEAQLARFGDVPSRESVRELKAAAAQAARERPKQLRMLLRAGR